MINGIRKAYGAGIRAGKSDAANPENPYTGRWNTLHFTAYELGFQEGLRQSLANWLQGQDV